MYPLSCINCCHNPLQLGPIGTAFGYCTRHRVILNAPQLTSCGQLLRKDLLASSARDEGKLHAAVFPRDHVVTVSAPEQAAGDLVEKANGQLPVDAVVDEVRSYGALDSKIATMAALHRIEGVRAEVAMLSLSRGYFRKCFDHEKRWTAGVHLLHWTLARLDGDPVLRATDLRSNSTGSLERTMDVARWSLLAFRLSFVADVGDAAARSRDPVVGRLASLPGARRWRSGSQRRQAPLLAPVAQAGVVLGLPARPLRTAQREAPPGGLTRPDPSRSPTRTRLDDPPARSRVAHRTVREEPCPPQ